MATCCHVLMATCFTSCNVMIKEMTAQGSPTHMCAGTLILTLLIFIVFTISCSIYSGASSLSRQLYLLFPVLFTPAPAHSPDNSFMGFIVEQHVNTTKLNGTVKLNQAVVYGKNQAMWNVNVFIIYNLYSETCHKVL